MKNILLNNYKAQLVFMTALLGRNSIYEAKLFNVETYFIYNYI